MYGDQEVGRSGQGRYVTEDDSQSTGNMLKITLNKLYILDNVMDSRQGRGVEENLVLKCEKDR